MSRPPEVKSAFEAFRIRPPETIALVGGGGKTTLRCLLGEEAVTLLYSVVTTTTTKTGPLGGPEADHIVVWRNPDERLQKVRSVLEEQSWVFTASHEEGRKIIGVEPEWVERIAREVDLVVIEADGCRHKPMKAHAAHEPVIPQSATLVIACIGAEVLDAPLSEETVHRCEEFSKLTGVQTGRPVCVEALSKAMEDPRGLRRGVPEKARFVPFINKIDKVPWESIQSLLETLQSPHVVYGEAQQGKFYVRDHPSGG